MAKRGKRGRPRVTPSNSDERVSATVDDGSHSNCQYETIVDGTPSKSRLGRDEVEPQSQADTNIQEISAQTDVRTQPKSSYASLVDPEEGNGLKFVPPQIVIGQKCDKIERNDTAVEIEYWANSIHCGVEEEEGQVGIETNYTRDPPVNEVSEDRPEQQSVLGGFIHPRRTAHRPLTVTTERLPEQNSFMALLEEEAPPAMGPAGHYCGEYARSLGVLGDFNAILHPEERIGGDDVLYTDIKDFAQCIKDCDMQEIRISEA
ncbi:hypothetical protein Cgig2_030848 [Carnegiea gigantea]|uniref:Uncharacterized protein n=1 Tax=Carnegiea gigantea TaxID=171969 RepID=A0A9Q1JJ83_9CARY|nr:hypothetical protein Cgig2_030848 [Carnegiea gigantea]